jgi:pilus assembly protein Flp/PilA
MFLYLAYHLSSFTSAARRRSEDGASAVEYGLLVALIAAIIVAAVFILGGTVNDAFTDTNEGIQTPSPAAATT